MPNSSGLDEQIRSGWSVFETGKYEKALDEFRKALKTAKDHEGALQGQIAALRKLQRFPEAAAVLESALSRYPTSIGILCERAWLHVERGEFDDALAAFDVVLAEDRRQHHHEHEQHIAWKVFLLIDQKRLDAAEETLSTEAACFPNSLKLRSARGWVYYHRTDYDEALKMFTSVLATNSQYESALQGKIATLRSQGKLSQARKVADEALKHLSYSPGIQSESGRVYLDQGHYSEAQEAFRAARDQIPRDPTAHLSLAWAYVLGSSQDPGEAKELCWKALELNGHPAQVYGCLGAIAVKQGLLREAERYLRRSVDLDPMKGLHVDLGSLYIETECFMEAELELDKAIEIYPDDPHAHLQRGRLYLETDRGTEALREFRRAITLAPTDPDMHQALALALMRGGRGSEAERVLRAAINRIEHGRKWKLHLALCQCLTEMGDETGDPQCFEEALKEANKAIRIEPHHSAPLYHSAIVRYKLHDYKGAEKNFRRSYALNTEIYDAKLNAERVKALIRKEHERSRVGRSESRILAGFFVFCFIAIFVSYLASDRVSENIFLITSPVLWGLILVSMMLPWLTRLKLTGFEAELNASAPKEALLPRPHWEIGFSKASQILN